MKEVKEVGQHMRFMMFDNSNTKLNSKSMSCLTKVINDGLGSYASNRPSDPRLVKANSIILLLYYINNLVSLIN